MSDHQGSYNNNNEGIDMDKRKRLLGAIHDLGFRKRDGQYYDFKVVFGWEDMQVHITGDDFHIDWDGSLFGMIYDDELSEDVTEILDRARDNNVGDAKEERALRYQVKKRIQLADSEDESADIRSSLHYFGIGNDDINSSSEEGLDEEEMDEV